ncbi:glycosyltransferase [Ectobacillus sp. JY-23]|uniref:glycosyltransferase n=1 Tax=Ectobacillus sp. JY-23 TaxID=2933872 RepID=UPI001FF5EC26|nr:glycosyltransferase [Ectobacillus sp. JY-23]UOY92693.1 glycosyltransferase [Ectobacillus sp. JY-23]
MSRCMDSLLNQTLQDIEIIAVNDGSVDGSLSLLQHYAALDTRIKVIDKENGGVSSARNTGLQVARAPYIGFVDPDDWVDDTMYETLYREAITHHADIVMCTYVREFETHSKVKDFRLPSPVIYQGNEVKQHVVRRLIGPIHQEIGQPDMIDAWGTIWNKLYRANCIKSGRVLFTDLEIIGTNEDTLFNLQVSCNAETFVFINTPFYHYWKGNETSVTSGYKPKLIERWFVLFDKMEDILKSHNMEEKYYQALDNRISLNVLGLGLNTISKTNKATALKKLLEVRAILRNSRIQRSFKQLDTSYLPIIWKFFYGCAKYRLSVVFYTMLITIEWLRIRVR